MAGSKKWSDLSSGRRRLLFAAAAAEGLLRIVTLIDIKRRPASQIRGRKWIWASVVSVIGSAGILPISYFLFGRRRQPS